MPSQYSTNKRTIGELLSSTSPSLVVPDWQRNFSWTRSEVEMFWLDVKAFSDEHPGNNITSQEYFLGAIVLVTRDAEFLLLDGQQRLATATILLSVIRDHLYPFREAAANRVQQKYISDYDDATQTAVHKLSLSRYDRDFFRQEVQEATYTGGSAPRAELESHRLIRKAKQFFEEQIGNLHDELGGGEDAFQWLLRMKKVLADHVSVVVVNSTNEENAATVFETLNDRGIGLSTPDLVRSFLLRRAPPSDVDEIMDCWRSVLEVADDAKVEDFLRHHWLSRVGDLKTRRLYKAIKSRLEDDGADSLQFSRDLRRSVAIYRDIVNARDDNAEIARLLQGVRMLGAKALLPSILSAYDTEPEDERLRFIKALIVLYVRHVVIGKLENSRLETVVYKVAKQLREDGDYGRAITAVREASPPDERFRGEFETATVPRQKSARYLLRELEHAKRVTGEVTVELPDRVHLEHIYPQTPQEARWPNHSAAVDRLGNLTLLSRKMNQAIGNAPFLEKRETYTVSDILLTNELAGYEEWNAQSIDSRQAGLADLARDIWAFPVI